MTHTKLWDAVSTTDPSDTKEVKFGRKFTAIDAYSQIQMATAQFGPVGIGWGWDVHYDYTIEDVIFSDLTLWYVHDGATGKVHASGGCALKGKPSEDSEAKKKALTDSITKALSYLGFNADVFRGKFDDSKYVTEVKQQLAKAKAKKTAEKQQAEVEEKIEGSLPITADQVKKIKAGCKKAKITEAAFKKKIAPMGFKEIKDITSDKYVPLLTRLTQLADQLGTA